MKNSQNVLITGTSRGIGLEFTRQYLAAGNTVFAVARNVGPDTKLGGLKRDFSDRLHLIRGDVTNAADRTAVVAAVSAVTDHLDLFVNNAGIYTDDRESDDLANVTEKALVDALATNSIAPVLLTKELTPLLAKAKAPKAAYISSLMGSIEDNGRGGAYAYRMSKVALNIFVKSLSRDFPAWITLALHPGWVATDMGSEEAPTSPTESVTGLVRVIAQATSKDSGAFIDYEGDRLPW